MLHGLKALLGALRGESLPSTAREQDRIERDLAIYRGCPPWLDKTGGRTMHLGRTVCGELARTALGELTAITSGGAWLERQIEALLPRLGEALSGVLGVGRGMLRLYPTENGVGVDFVLPDRYAVMERDGGGRATRVCFMEEAVEDGRHYLRVEEHRRGAGGEYCIENRLWLTEGGRATKQVPLSRAHRFAAYPPLMRFTGMEVGFFVEWRLGGSVAGEEGSSLWGDAVSLMEDADRQYERLLWEFEGGELAVEATEDAFCMDKGGALCLPKGKERLFRVNLLDGGQEGGTLQVFSPALRDEAHIRGLNRILMLFEDAVGLARGTVSDPAVAARTATEVQSLRQRTYLTVRALRAQIDRVVRELARGTFEMGVVYGMCPCAPYELTLRFGDGVLQGSDEERQADREDTRAGLMSREEYRRKWYGGE